MTSHRPESPVEHGTRPGDLRVSRGDDSLRLSLWVLPFSVPIRCGLRSYPRGRGALLPSATASCLTGSPIAAIR
jgi:hypothetical protein